MAQVPTGEKEIVAKTVFYRADLDAESVEELPLVVHNGSAHLYGLGENGEILFSYSADDNMRQDVTNTWTALHRAHPTTKHLNILW